MVQPGICLGGALIWGGALLTTSGHCEPPGQGSRQKNKEIRLSFFVKMYFGRGYCPPLGYACGVGVIIDCSVYKGTVWSWVCYTFEARGWSSCVSGAPSCRCRYLTEIDFCNRSSYKRTQLFPSQSSYALTDWIRVQNQISCRLTSLYTDTSRLQIKLRKLSTTSLQLSSLKGIERSVFMGVFSGVRLVQWSARFASINVLNRHRTRLLITPPRQYIGHYRGRGIVSIDFFVYVFLCQQDYQKTAGPICMKFSGKVWSDHGTT